MGRRARRTFTKEYKAEVVGLVRQGDKTIGALSSDLGLTESAVRNWVAQAEIDAGKGPPGALTTAERQELAQLRRDNRRLRMERDILKKATAFFARENK